MVAIRLQQNVGTDPTELRQRMPHDKFHDSMPKLREDVAADLELACLQSVRIPCLPTLP